MHSQWLGTGTPTPMLERRSAGRISELNDDGPAHTARMTGLITCVIA